MDMNILLQPGNIVQVRNQVFYLVTKTKIIEYNGYLFKNCYLSFSLKCFDLGQAFPQYDIIKIYKPTYTIGETSVLTMILMRDYCRLPDNMHFLRELVHRIKSNDPAMQLIYPTESTTLPTIF